jgi:hypothetical protein
MGKRWTSPLEVVAYIIAHVIGIILVSVWASLFMGTIYVQVANTYGRMAVMMVGLVQSLVVMLIVLFIFLALRVGMMGGIPRLED